MKISNVGVRGWSWQKTLFVMTNKEKMEIVVFVKKELDI